MPAERARASNCELGVAVMAEEFHSVASITASVSYPPKKEQGAAQVAMEKGSGGVGTGSTNADGQQVSTWAVG